MKEFRLIGRDIDYSLSPAIHNYIFKLNNISARYDIMNLKNQEEISHVISMIRDGKIHGLNITVPYKKYIIDHIDKIDNKSKQINAINCVSAGIDNSIIGYNTDWLGFKKFLLVNNIDLKNKDIKIIGNGGSSKAVQYVLRTMNICKVNVYVRDNKNNDHKNLVDLYNDIDDNSIIINATPYHFINMDQNIADRFITTNCMWIDLLYTKLSTSLLKKMEISRYFNGIDMLIFQAIASQDIWFRNNITEIVNLDDIKMYLNKDYNVK